MENDVELGQDEGTVESEYPQSPLARVFVFLRSVMPADPWHSVFLLGTILIFISPRLAWVPIKIINSLGLQWSRLSPEDTDGVVALLRGLLVPIVLASLVSGYLCFWAGRRQLWRLLLGVICPAALGLLLIAGEFFNWTQGARSLFGRPQAVVLYDWLRVSVKLMPTGTYVCALGLFLVTVMTIRVGLGLSSLPLSLRSTHPASPDEDVSWHRLKLVIYFVVFLFFLFSQASGKILYFLYPRVRDTGFRALYVFVAEAMASILGVAVCILVGGIEARKDFRKSSHRPKLRYPVLAFVTPIGFSLLISSVLYLYARTEGVGFTKLSFRNYFVLAGLWHAGLLMAAFPAFAEEYIFRGLFLRRLVGRYGFHRGIFLTGIIWAAFHFHSGAQVGFSFGQVFLELIYRTLICLAMNYGLAWLTLRSGSIIPAAIAHTVSNMLIHAGVNGTEPLANYVRIVLWAGLALVLFRYWPPRDEAVQDASAQAPASVTAG